MRAGAALLPAMLITIAGCAQDFDEDFAETEKELSQQAETLDKELAEQMEAELGAEKPEAGRDTKREGKPGDKPK